MTTFELSTWHALGPREVVSTIAVDPECELGVAPTTARFDGFGTDGLRRAASEDPAWVMRTAQ